MKILETPKTVPARNTVIRKSGATSKATTAAYVNEKMTSLYKRATVNLSNVVNSALDAFDAYTAYTGTTNADLKKQFSFITSKLNQVKTLNKDIQLKSDNSLNMYEPKILDAMPQFVSARSTPEEKMSLYLRQAKSLSFMLYSLIDSEYNRYTELVDGRNTIKKGSATETEIENQHLEALNNLLIAWNGFMRAVNITLSKHIKHLI